MSVKAVVSSGIQARATAAAKQELVIFERVNPE
jgi:hypothetical protein